MEKASPQERKIGLLVFLGVAMGVGALVLCERVLGFDVGRLFDPCGFKQRTHLPCITCGWTRATRACARGALGEAFLTQPAAALINLLVIWAGITGLYIAVTGRLPRFVVRLYRDLKRWHLGLALCIILLGGWAVTLARALAENGR